MWSVIGFEENKKYFEKVLKAGRFSHAYVFWGPEMIGKRKFAEELYLASNKSVFSLVGDPDLKFVSPRLSDGETKIYIEDAREIKNFFILKPFHGPYKFAIVNDADRLTAEASNAILKILEEPPAPSVLILITSKPKFLMPTVLSRCQLIKFKPLKHEQIADYLKPKKLSTEDREFLLRAANGRLGWVINLIEAGNLDAVKKNISEFEKILKQGIFEKIQYARQIYEKGDYLSLVTDYLNYRHTEVALDGNQRIIRALLQLYNLLSQPQFNHRLALENFLLSV